MASHLKQGIGSNSPNHDRMPNPLIILSQPIEGTSFGLNFQWKEDRFEHTVFARPTGASQDLVLLTSLEGNDAQDWPPSPPLQDIHLQEIGGSQVAMAVGMAGSSHWSAACSLNESATKVRLHFDMACRADRTPDWLGSTYQSSSAVGVNDDPSLGALIQLPNFELQIQPLDVEGQSTQFNTTDQQIQMSAPLNNSEKPASHPPKSPSRTIRWQYQFAIRRTP